MNMIDISSCCRLGRVLPRRWLLALLVLLQGLVGCNSDDTAEPEKSIIKSGFGCMAVSGELGFYYSVDTLVGDDRLVTCMVMDSYYSHSNSMLLRRWSVGADEGACSIGYDFDVPNGGYFRFTDLSDRKVIYLDNGSTYNKTTVYFPNSSCTFY
jgi:hypothetical protein